MGKFSRPCKAMASKKNSGTTWTEADYEAQGWKTVKLRLKPEHYDALSKLAEQWGCTRQQAAGEAFVMVLGKKRAKQG